MKARAAAVPYVVWMALFVVAPLILVVVYAFSSRDGAFTLGNFSSMTQFVTVFGRSFLMAALATAICFLVGYPLAYYLARESALIRKVSMMLIMLPMWMNFLLRTYAWMAILEDTGLINRLLAFLGLPALRMINTPGAVILGMVYNFLPFMVLPIFSVIDRIDGRVIEAAQDLGADGTVVFRRSSSRSPCPAYCLALLWFLFPRYPPLPFPSSGGGKTMLLAT
jgi:spermidine/putrescine transport system permease protein